MNKFIKNLLADFVSLFSTRYSARGIVNSCSFTIFLSLTSFSVTNWTLPVMSSPAVQENTLPSPTVDMSSQQELQYLTEQLGEFGKYQLIQHLLHCLVWVVGASHMMGFVFVFPVMEHRCYIPQIDDNSGTSEFPIESYIPKTTSGKLTSCSKFKLFPNQDNTTVPCGDGGYIYSSDYYEYSRVMEWDLICEREWMRALLQSVFLFGAMIAAFIGGALADTFGRKPILFWSGVLSFFCGLGSVFLDNFYVVTFFMLFYGFFGSGAGNSPSLALTMELVGPSWRAYCASAIGFACAIGGIIVAGIAYFMPVNARILHLIYVCSSLLLFANWWLVDESIPWLWGQGEYDKAVKIIQKAAKVNGVTLTLPPVLRRTSRNLRRRSTLTEINLMLKSKRENIVGILSIVRTPELRKRTLIIMFTWFAGGLLYYGLSFGSVNLFGNPFLTFIITCVAELPSYPISILLTPKTGYKPMLWVSVLLPGITCVVIAFLPSDIISTSIAMLAKVSATVTFNVAYAYTAELFPTVVRNTAVGLCVMAARVGASLIPQFYLLEAFSDKLPNIVIGVAGILAGVGVLLFLPETMNKPIPQTIEDVENYKRKIGKETRATNNNIIEHQEDSISLI